MVSNWSISSSELNQKVFSVFPGTLQYRARLKGPLFLFCLALWDFFVRKFFPKMSFLSFFWCVQAFLFFFYFFWFHQPFRFFFDVLQQWMLKNSKGFPARQIASAFAFFRFSEIILDFLKCFCYFWVLDMAPTYAVSGLFVLIIIKLNPKFLKMFQN